MKQSTINKVKFLKLNSILFRLLRFFAKGTPTATKPRNDGIKISLLFFQSFKALIKAFANSLADLGPSAVIIFPDITTFPPTISASPCRT